MRGVVASTLRRLGFEVHEANDGKDALTLSDAISGPLALVVTDIRMPNLDGERLAEELCRRRPDTPVLFMTGFADPPAERPRRLLLRKPFSTADLVDAVEALLPASDPA